MKAAVLCGPGDVKLENINMPDLKPEWVLIKVKAVGICGSDLHFYKEKTSIPIISEIGIGKYVPGHELSGEIYAVGLNVSGLNVGDRVAVEPIIKCNKCQWCRVGWYNLCEDYKLIGFHYNGGMAEYCAVPSENCFKLPEQVSFEDAAMLDCIATALHAINKMQICSEDRVLILGAGTIGLLALQIALIEGAYEVYVSGTHDFQLEIAKKLGATAVINVNEERLTEKILKLTNGKGVDKVLEAAGGSSNVLSDAFEATRKRGLIVTTGIFTKPLSLDMFKFLTKELVLISSWGYSYHVYRQEFETALNLLTRCKINVSELITHRYPLEKTKDAFEAALNKQKNRSIKVQITP